MINIEVAKCYLKSVLEDVQRYNDTHKEELCTITSNLKYIDKLLEHPVEENPDHDWKDFK